MRKLRIVTDNTIRPAENIKEKRAEIHYFCSFMIRNNSTSCHMAGGTVFALKYFNFQYIFQLAQLCSSLTFDVNVEEEFERTRTSICKKSCHDDDDCNTYKFPGLSLEYKNEVLYNKSLHFD